MPSLNTRIMNIHGSNTHSVVWCLWSLHCWSSSPLEGSCHCVPLHAATSAINVEVLATLLAPYKEPHANSSCPKHLTQPSTASHEDHGTPCCEGKSSAHRTDLSRSSSRLPRRKVPYGKPVTQKGWRNGKGRDVAWLGADNRKVIKIIEK